MPRTNCVYCNSPITTRSSEHVIQNALGGLYESSDICCPACNNYVSKYIDVPFTKIFNPIISRIPNFSKSNNRNSVVSYTGTVLYNEKKYSATIKDGKVVACPELSRELKSDISKIPLKIISFDFNIEDNAFRNGISKIAFNYALDKGIDLSLLQHGLSVTINGTQVENINFNYPQIPFVPLNPIDGNIELNSNTDLYHNMILFSQHNQLWCYIDLFNTFQYYVLLSEKFPETKCVHENYIQSLQKIDRTLPKLYINSPKDIYTYSMEYGIEPCIDIPKFTRRVQNAILRKSQKQQMQNIISKKLNRTLFLQNIVNSLSPEMIPAFYQSLLLYFDDNDCLRTENFRTATTTPDGTKIVSYPILINHLIDTKVINPRDYTYAKFAKLNKMLADTHKK